jgi:hypothetical protein
MNWLPGAVAILVLTLSAACAEPGHPSPEVYRSCAQPVGRSPEGVLEVCGRLDRALVQAAVSQLAPTDRELVLTSGGGISPAAITLARALNARGLTVRVRGFCLSACSTYVLLTARSVIVEPGAIVAFHHTGANALEAIAYRSRRPVPPAVLQPAADERAFFGEAGLEPVLLDQLGMAVEPSCFGIRARAQGGRERFMNYRWSWFIPTHAEAEAMFRGRLSGYWPSSAEEAEQAFAALLGRTGTRVKYGVLPPAIAPADLAATLPTCAGSLTPEG